MSIKPTESELRYKRELVRDNPDYLHEHITSPTEIKWVIEQIEAEIQDKKKLLNKEILGYKELTVNNADELIKQRISDTELYDIEPLRDEKLKFKRHYLKVKYPDTVDENHGIESQNDILESIDSTKTQKIKLLNEIGLIDKIRSNLKNPESNTDLINVLNFFGITEIKNPKSKSTEYRTLMKLFDESDQLESTDLTEVMERLQLQKHK